MGIAGVILSFLPHELLSYLNAAPTKSDALMLQILGALYLAFAMVNWTAKANLIGGIYSRPIAIGNLTHFMIGALALIKGFWSINHLLFQAITFIYIVFAVLFGIVFFRHPVADK
jgi:hypothetical protein